MLPKTKTILIASPYVVYTAHQSCFHHFINYWRRKISTKVGIFFTLLPLTSSGILIRTWTIGLFLILNQYHITIPISPLEKCWVRFRWNSHIGLPAFFMFSGAAKKNAYTGISIYLIYFVRSWLSNC